MNRISVQKRTRIQRKNRRVIREAALEVFSQHGFRGATLDQIAAQAGLSKPNVLYYFDSKEAIHRSLLEDLLEIWIEPLARLDPRGDPVRELLGYVRRKLQMSRELPRESRLFANEVLQGAPRVEEFIRGDLRRMVEEKAEVIRSWTRAGLIADVDPWHLIFSIWALTQHYADFAAQIRLIRGDEIDPLEGAEPYLERLFRQMLTPD